MGVYYYSAPTKESKWTFPSFEKQPERQVVVNLFEASDWPTANGEPTVWGNGVFILEDSKTGKYVLVTMPGTGYLQ